MKFKKNLTLCALLVLFFSCKKDYTCQCSNAFGVYDAGTVTKTKGQAKKHCESLSAGQTSCKLK